MRHLLQSAARLQHDARMQQGTTLVEMLGALAVGAMLMATIVSMQMDADKAKLALYLQRQQKIVADAAAAYVNANWQTLTDRIAAVTTADKVLQIPVSEIVTAGYLPSGDLPGGWQAVNAFGQTQCLLVASNGATPKGLAALLVTGGGREIPLDLLWPAAALSGHGAGVLQTSSTGMVEAVGVRAQWRIATGIGQPFGAADCNGNALAAGRLATLLTLMSPQQTGTSQAIVRSGASRLEEVTVSGTVTINRTVIAGAGSTVVVNDTCTATQKGSLTATATGEVLTCTLSGIFYKWLPTGGASAINGLDAEKLRLRQFSKLDTSCERLGEWGLIEGADGTRDGAMGYCFFDAAKNALVWKKVGGQWKFVSMGGTALPGIKVYLFSPGTEYLAQTPIDFQTHPDMLANPVPSSARVVQVNLYAQNTTKGPSTLSVVYFPPGSENAIEVLRIPPGMTVGSTLLVPNAPMVWHLRASSPGDVSQSEIIMRVEGYVDGATE